MVVAYGLYGSDPKYRAEWNPHTIPRQAPRNSHYLIERNRSRPGRGTTLRPLRYCTGAIRNSELVHSVFPGWTTRFYHREDVPEKVLNELRTNGAELVLMKKGSKTTQGDIAGMFWRFLVADEIGRAHV